jgi:hypothetical protein
MSQRHRTSGDSNTETVLYFVEEADTGGLAYYARDTMTGESGKLRASADGARTSPPLTGEEIPDSSEPVAHSAVHPKVLVEMRLSYRRQAANSTEDSTGTTDCPNRRRHVSNPRRRRLEHPDRHRPPI